MKRRVWDADKGQELLALKAHTERACSARFSPTANALPVAADKTVKVWDAERDREILTLKGHTNILRSVCFSPDGKRMPAPQGPDGEGVVSGRRSENWAP